MANEHVATPFRKILASIVKPVESEADTRPTTTRDKFLVLSGLYEELIAAGAHIDIGQLDWVIREFESRMRELEGERQYRYEQARQERLSRKFEEERLRKYGSSEIHDSDIDPGGIR
jgi:hypothetical protein